MGRGGDWSRRLSYENCRDPAGGLLGLAAKAGDVREDEQGWKQPVHSCRLLA